MQQIGAFLGANWFWAGATLLAVLLALDAWDFISLRGVLARLGFEADGVGGDLCDGDGDGGE